LFVCSIDRIGAGIEGATIDATIRVAVL